MPFKEQFNFIYKFFLDSPQFKKNRASFAEFARFLGVTQGKMQAWRELGQRPKAKDLALLHQKLGLSYAWLATGTGDPFAVEHPEGQASAPDMLHEPPVPATPQSIPLVGFASCGVQGWFGRMTYPVAVQAPHLRPGMIAVMATGESMLPEGIGHGHICFCDPTAVPIEGECVYVEQKDDTATLKRFLGMDEMEGGVPAVLLRGWLDREGDAPQKPFTIKARRDFVKVLAPVVYVQKRM